MVVPDLVPRPLVDNTFQIDPQLVSLPECCSACRPAGCQPRKQSRWPYHLMSRRRTQHTHTFCLGPKSIAGSCVMLCSVSAWHETSQIFFLSDIAPKCVTAFVYVCVCMCVRAHAQNQHGWPDVLLLLLLLFLLYTADRALISLVWSSQMEPEHDLFPGETVCFLCPACTKSHIVPLPISHTDSPLQVLGYLVGGGSDFRSFFFYYYLIDSQEYSITFSHHLVPKLNMVYSNFLVLSSESRDSLLCSFLSI